MTLLTTLDSPVRPNVPLTPVQLETSTCSYKMRVALAAILTGGLAVYDYYCFPREKLMPYWNRDEIALAGVTAINTAAFLTALSLAVPLATSNLWDKNKRNYRAAVTTASVFFNFLMMLAVGGNMRKHNSEVIPIKVFTYAGVPTIALSTLAVFGPDIAHRLCGCDCNPLWSSNGPGEHRFHQLRDPPVSESGYARRLENITNAQRARGDNTL